jgi:hypothetical protein
MVKALTPSAGVLRLALCGEYPEGRSSATVNRAGGEARQVGKQKTPPVGSVRFF